MLCDQNGSRETCREAKRDRNFRKGASEPKSHKDTQPRSQGAQEATKLRNHTPPAQRNAKKVEMSKETAGTSASQTVTEASSQRPKRPRSSRGNEAQKPYPTSREKIKESANS